MRIENKSNNIEKTPPLGNPSNPLNYFPVISGKYLSYLLIDLPRDTDNKCDPSVQFIPVAIDIFINIGLVTGVAIPLITLSAVGEASAVGFSNLGAAATGGAILFAARNFFGLLI